MWGTGVALVVALGLFLSACAGPGYTYVSSTGTRTYFRVPSQWKLYTKQQLLVAANLQESKHASNSFPFLAGYDGDPHPSITHVLALATVTQYPVVRAEVQRLSPSGHEQLSVAGLRNSVYAVDQLLQNDAADILTYKEVVESGGYHGVRMVFNVSLEGNLTVAPGNQVMRISRMIRSPSSSLKRVWTGTPYPVEAGTSTIRHTKQVPKLEKSAIDALVDPATSLLYLLVVRCSAACYKANQTAIDQIISSFTVRAH